MIPGILAAAIATINRQLENIIRVEYCVVLEVDKRGTPGVKNHEKPDSHYFNTCSIKARMIRQQGDPEKAMNAVQMDCIVLQRSVGNRFGEPWTPRVGDFVAVLFMFNNKPLILGSLVTLSQPPVVRGPSNDPKDGQYDRVNKWCQWQKPDFDENLDAYNHPQGKMPICDKIFHGPSKGETGPGRDWQIVYDCKKGDKDPTCKDCIRIDSVPRCSEAWDKVYSEDTESCEAPPKRMERHAKCGSYIRIESECGKSLEYSEGQGHIRIGNAVKESEKRGHINFQGNVAGHAGTIDMHAEHEELSYDTEHHGARTSVVANADDSVLWACETIYFDVQNGQKGADPAYIRIMKDGQIIIHTPKKITIESTEDQVHIKAFTKIVLEAPLIEEVTDLVDNQGDQEIAGFCTHPDCTCHTS
jgi:hypothetical protein